MLVMAQGGPQPIGFIHTPGVYQDRESCDIASEQFIIQSVPQTFIAYDCQKTDGTDSQ